MGIFLDLLNLVYVDEGYGLFSILVSNPSYSILLRVITSLIFILAIPYEAHARSMSCSLDLWVICGIW